MSIRIYLEDSFKDKCKQYGNNAIMSLFHMNIRSLSKHQRELELYINNLGFNFNVIALTETWCTHNNVGTASLNGYKHEYKYRDKKIGGGVSLFVKNCFNYHVREDLCMFNFYIEL